MKKKGFTLIELLAVILILGIIALIAIPTVTNIIKESKRGAFKSSVQNIIGTVETECQLEQMKGETLTASYKFTNGTVDNGLNIKGKLPTSGAITVDSSCNVEVNVSSKDFCATKALDSEDVLVGDIEDGDCIIGEDNTDNNEGNDNNEDDNEPQGPYTCIRATSLHTASCTQESNFCFEAGYSASGSKGTSTITYGQTGTKGTLKSGDAFDCDVNNDGTYDPTKERFYYVSDYYNTSTLEFETDKATLIYYNNVANGVPNSTSASFSKYYTANENWHGPLTAITKLPTRTQWTNPNLITGTRAIVTENGANSTSGGTLPTAFDYTEYAARLLTTQEVEKACGITVGTMTKGELDNCDYLMENTRYSASSMGTGAYWLENPSTSSSSFIWYVFASSRDIFYMYDNINISMFGVRPAISISKSYISY